MSAQVLPRAALSPVSQSQQRDALRGGGLRGLMGDPRFPSPCCRRGAPGPPFHPSLLQEGCMDFHQKIQLRVDHRNKSFIKGTGDSEPNWHSRHRGRSGGAATWRQSQSSEGGQPTPRAPLSAGALMQTPSSASEQLPIWGVSGTWMGESPHNHGDSFAGPSTARSGTFSGGLPRQPTPSSVTAVPAGQPCFTHKHTEVA